jgi:alpha-tubulin suppressor-like RCC1 family protein
MMRTIVAGALATASLATVPLTAVAGPAAGAAGPAVAATSLQAWGINLIGQLGNGTKSDFSKVPVPATLPAGTRLRSVSAGCGFSLAVTSDGQLLSWGGNRDGRLGLGPDGPRSSLVPVPARIPPGDTITAAAAGCHHALALTASGEVLAWGKNLLGSVGTGRDTDAPVLTPTRVRLPHGAHVISIGAGYDTSVAVTASGSVWTWGTGQFGQLGNGTQGGPGTNSPAPVRVPLPAGVKGRAVVTGTGNDFVLTTTGQVYGWGGNGLRELGAGLRVRIATRPVRVLLPAGTRVASLAAGCDFTLARTTAGAVIGWGANQSRVLAGVRAPFVNRPRPLGLPAGIQVTALGASCESSLALTSGGQILAWGQNGRGELGTGGHANINPTPAQVALPDGFTATRIGAGSQAHGGYALGH